MLARDSKFLDRCLTNSVKKSYGSWHKTSQQGLTTKKSLLSL